MDNFEIIDVTLRDGGYLNDFYFNEMQLETVLIALDSSGIDYIEVGYRNGTIIPIENTGMAGLSPNDYIQFCKQFLKNSKISVMAHSNHFNKQDIKELKDCGVSLLRLSIQQGELEAAFPFIRNALEEGLLISLNFVRISQYLHADIMHALESVMPYEPSIIYFADTNGCLHPDRVMRLFAACTQQFNIPFGYHSHDNLGLAQTNALAALTCGATYIDASLAGASKGIGNVKLEFLIAYLHSINNTQYELHPLITASNYIRTQLPNCGHVSIDEFTRGIFDLSTQQLCELKTFENLR